MVSRSLLSLSTLALLAAVPASFGPPTLCQPLDIGEAKSLPFGKKAIQADPEYRIDRLLADTLGILATSTDAEVHFETLRRAALYLQSESHAHRAKMRSAGKLAGDLHRALRSRVLDTVSEPGSSKRAQALAWFDLGLFMLDMQILGHPQEGRMWAYLQRSGQLMPADPGLNMGLFAAGFSHRKPGWWKPYLAKAVANPDGLPKLTRKNLLALTKRFLGVKDMPALVREYSPGKGAKKR